MKHDYAKSLRKLDFVLPLLDAWGLEKNAESFLDALASYWNPYFALNCPLMQFSVFNFFTKNAKFVLRFGRSFQVVLIRFAFVYVYGMFQVNKTSPISMESMLLIFMILHNLFKSFYHETQPICMESFSFGHARNPQVLLDLLAA